MAGLDGIRALAVLCVIAYHLGSGSAPGGMLGVGVFFTLSGYLITDILLGQWKRYGNLDLAGFWVGRARRLLPALFLMLVAVSVWVALFDADQLGAVRRQVISAALYFANWSTIAQHHSYFARFAAPLPLDHLWSLSIEEQFYLVWPWLLIIAIWIARGRVRLSLVVLAGAAASAYAMGHLYHAGYDPTRAYEGTDSRAFGLLIGAALAAFWPSQPKRLAGRADRAAPLDAIGVIGLVAIGVLVARTDSFTPFLYPYGFVILSVASAAVIAAVVNPTSRLGPILGCGPLRWIGVRSYGIYLWQWPIIVLATPSQQGPQWLRSALEVAGTFAIAALSWRYVEEPIRQGALGRRRARIGTRVRRGRSRLRAAVPAAVVPAALGAAVLGLTGALPAVSGDLASAGAAAKASQSSRPLEVGYTTTRKHAVHQPRGIPNRTACRSTVYIGDSTSEGEISASYIPSPKRRLESQLRKVGVKQPYSEISGARSIVETYQGQPNGADVARAHAQGFRGCWILALGTNDVADVNVGSQVGFRARIERMMSIIGRRPVLWVDAVTLVRSGPYADADMQRWNRTLVAECPRYPNMRVFDWGRWARPKWFIPDGIHYYSPGYVARAHLIARALTRAFPAKAPPSAGCVVQ